MPSINEFNQGAIALALQNLCGGVFYEPRIFYDSITMPATAGTVQAGNPDVFRNGEQFPVRITHMLAAYRPNSTSRVNPDETQIQRANLRIIQHDNFYMNRQLMPLPHWANVINAAPDIVTQGTSSWRFQHPYILSSRDSMQIGVALEATPATATTVGATIHGYGLLSKQPYFLSGTVSLTTTVASYLNTDNFRNDGAEPIVCTELSVFCGAPSGASSPAGDIRQLRISVKQVGNGTNQKWNLGPLNPTLLECPAMLYGITTGRTIVHRIPEDGWVWEPGEGVSVEVSESVTSDGAKLAIAFAGHLVVT